jgi:lipid A disaccharide synthetase
MSIAARILKNTPYITLVNLLAGKELFPERFGYYCSSNWVCDQLSEWVKFPEKRNALAQELGALKASIISAGASKKGAIEIINFIENKKAQAVNAA